MGTRIERGKLVFPDGTVQETAGGGSQTVTHATPANTLDTNYTNGNKWRMVSVSLRLTRTLIDGATVTGKIHATATPPTTIVAQVYAQQGIADVLDMMLFFMVAPGWKYRVEKTAPGGASVVVQRWEEWDLF